MDVQWSCHWFQRPQKVEQKVALPAGKKTVKVKDHDILIKPRSLPILLVDKSSVFLVGGTVGTTDNGKWEAFVGDMQTGGSPNAAMRWDTVTIGGKAAPPPRTCFSVTPQMSSSNASVVLFGGCNDKQCFSEMWELKVEGGTLNWSQLTYKGGSAIPQKRYAHAAAFDVRSGMFYVHGGCTNPATNHPEDSLSDLWCFDPTTRSWTELTPTVLEGEDKPSPRSHHTLIISGGWIYVVGGWGGLSSVDDVWKLPCAESPTLADRSVAWRKVRSWPHLPRLSRIPMGLSHVVLPLRQGLHVWVHGEGSGLAALDCGGAENSQGAENSPSVRAVEVRTLGAVKLLPRDASAVFWQASSSTLFVSCGNVGFTKLADLWLCKMTLAEAL